MEGTSEELFVVKIVWGGQIWLNWANTFAFKAGSSGTDLLTRSALSASAGLAV